MEKRRVRPSALMWWRIQLMIAILMYLFSHEIAEVIVILVQALID